MFNRHILMRRLTIVGERPPWSFLEVTNTVSILLIGLALVGQTVATLLFGDMSNAAANGPSVWLAGWNIGAALTIVIVYLTRRRTPESIAAMHLGPAPLNVPFAMLLGIAAAVTVNLLAGFIGGTFSPVAELVFLRDEPAGTWLLAILFMVMLQPVAEELVFRAILLPKVRHTFGPWGGIAISVGTYMLIYYVIYGSILQQSPALLWYGLNLPLLMGLFYSVLYIYTASTRVAIAAHIGARIFWLLSALVLYTP